MTGQAPPGPAPGEFTDALAGFATGVAVLTVRDGRDDLGATITSFMSVSLEPPLVAASVMASSYLAEVLGRRDRWAVTVLSAGQRALAGRFAAAGRPSARLLLAGEAHHRGPLSGALIAEEGMAALECRTVERVPAGDHLLVVAEVPAVDYVRSDLSPLIRVRRRYL
ncbi:MULTISPECIES: flavin reductase family protein [Thermomonospora]|uniref:flavin reductase family protein n=1 Tax=Thermomonospora sp. CIF 1 TaxID=1916083 RepID=UPI00059C4D04|nr:MULTISPECIES: flavin reductase family protein [Thermomonospora]